MVFIVLWLVAGLVCGFFCPVAVPVAYAKIFAVALIAAFSSLLGGVSAALGGVFVENVFVGDFFVNVFVAVFIVYVGSLLGLDLYYVALLGYGLKIFDRLSALWRVWMDKRA